MVSKQSAALSSATQHAMLPEFVRKLRRECLNTGSLCPTLPCAEYSLKLIFLKFYLIKKTYIVLTCQSTYNL